MDAPQKKGFGSTGIGWLALPVGAILLQVALWSQLFFVPPGSDIRPMGAALLSGVISIVALSTGFVLAGVLAYRRRFVISVLCLVLSLANLPLGMFLLRGIAAWRGLILSD